VKAGAVLYAKDVASVQAFYRHVAGLTVTHTESDHVVLESPSFQLVVLQIPEAIAASIQVERPAKRRTETPIKLVFPVESIAQARTAALAHGGELNPPEREWTFRGCRVCDGQDPEGNVVQLRQAAR
jgi:predicted enzyme related to lactoylglutathione lyase